MKEIRFEAIVKLCFCYLFYQTLSTHLNEIRFAFLPYLWERTKKKKMNTKRKILKSCFQVASNCRIIHAIVLSQIFNISLLSSHSIHHHNYLLSMHVYSHFGFVVFTTFHFNRMYWIATEIIKDKNNKHKTKLCTDFYEYFSSWRDLFGMMVDGV